MKKQLRFIPVYTGLIVAFFLAAKTASNIALEKRYREATEVLKKYFEQSRKEDWKDYVDLAESILNED